MCMCWRGNVHVCWCVHGVCMFRLSVVFDLFCGEECVRLVSSFLCLLVSCLFGVLLWYGLVVLLCICLLSFAFFCCFFVLQLLCLWYVCLVLSCLRVLWACVMLRSMAFFFFFLVCGCWRRARSHSSSSPPERFGARCFYLCFLFLFFYAAWYCFPSSSTMSYIVDCSRASPPAATD